MNYSFKKNFNHSNDFDKSFDLGVVEYHKCPKCGLVKSFNHSQMSLHKWEAVNKTFHEFIENQNNTKVVNQPPYIEISQFINILLKEKIVEAPILDWGGGYGSLAKILLKYHNVPSEIFEKYLINNKDKLIDYVDKTSLKVKSYNLVISTAVFEHVTERETLDSIIKQLSNRGSLLIHTLICDSIPNDPSWFYLLPVHTTFFTNKSMAFLMKQWGFVSSIYCPRAKSWILLKTNSSKLLQTIDSINSLLQEDYLIFKQGFVNYWK